MIRVPHRARRATRVLLAAACALSLMAFAHTSVFAHARFSHSDPPADSALDGTPFIMRAWFTQELTLHSTIRVVDAAGTQVDLGDGQVDQDDPDRKQMIVSLPELAPGVYTVEFVAESAEDGHPEPGTFAFGVGLTPPTADSAPGMDPRAAPTVPGAAAPTGSFAPADDTTSVEETAPALGY
ncbi:MAG: copper resistance protein CopC [Chloroflexi bacterium]|nr:copper resistance protein CopC [Chloroflexota bacterium]